MAIYGKIKFVWDGTGLGAKVEDISRYNYEYIYDDGELLITTDNEPEDKHTILPYNKIKADIIDQNRQIVFSIDPTNFGYYSQYSAFSKHTLKIKVLYYIIIASEFSDENIKYLTFYNKKYSKFLGLYQIHKHNKDENGFIDTATIDTNSCKNLSKIKYKDIEFEVTPALTVTTSIVKYNYNVGFLLKFNSNKTIDDLYQIMLIFRKSLQFCFYRTNIEIGEIDLGDYYEFNGNKIPTKLGKMYLIDDDKSMEDSDLSKFDDFGFISWNMVYPYFVNIFDNVSDNKLYLNSLPSKKTDKETISLNRIPLDFSAFEYEFSKLYPHYKTNKLNNPDYIDLLKKIDNISLNENQKNIKDNMTGIYLKSASLHERLEFALKDFNEVIHLKNIYDFMFGKNDNYISDIIKKFKKIRNGVDHGDIDIKTDSTALKIMYLIRILNYSMQLQRLGYEKNQIWIVLENVFEFDNRIR